MTAPFNARSTTDDVLAGVDLAGKRILVTGVSAGLGVETARVPGRSGVWLRADPERGLPERKVAAIGIRVSRGVAMHGFALNCDVSLDYYDRFVPCGIADAGVTSLTRELGRPVGVDDVLPLLERRLPSLSIAAAVRT